MNDDHITRLTTLRDELAEIKTPNYPNTFWSLINSWIAKATPIIRRDWKEFLDDFQKIAVEPNNPRIVYHNSDFSMSKQERCRQWEIGNSETEEVKQNILGFLNGLLILPENSKNKKTPPKNKKIKSPVEVLVAKYGLFGTLVVAIFGLLSAGITAYFGYMGIRAQIEAPILATQTAVARLTEVTYFSDMTQLANIPTPTNTYTPTFTPTSTLTTTPSPTLLASNTSTRAPTATPTIAPRVFRGLDKNCIDDAYWKPTPIFPSDNLTLDKNGCWNLTPWGIITENQSIKFVITDDIFNERVTRSIYTTLGNNVIIEFKIKVTLLTSSSDMDGIVFVGVGSKTSYSEPGYFLKYVVPARETKSYFVFAPDYFSYWEPRIEYAIGDVQAIKIVINDSDVSIQINGKEVKRPSLLPSKREVLWIGYSTPASSNYINATISEFRIYDE